MKLFDPLQFRKVIALISPANYAASLNGAALDISGCEGKIAVIRSAGLCKTAAASVAELIANAAHDASLNGDDFDLTPYSGKVKIVLQSGLCAGEGTNTLDVKIQEKDGEGDYSDVADGAFVQVTDAAGNGVQVIEIDTDAVEDTIRIVATLGNLAVASFGVMLIGVEASPDGVVNTLDVKIQQSADDGESWNDIQGAAFTQVTDAEGNGHEIIELDTQAIEGVIRAVATLGDGSSCALAVKAILSEKYPA